jgi:hypothetical protein
MVEKGWRTIEKVEQMEKQIKSLHNYKSGLRINLNTNNFGNEGGLCVDTGK